MKSRLKPINGEIKIESELQKGTKIMFFVEK